MGTGWYVTCRKCRKTYYCGYGSYKKHEERTQPAVDKHKDHDPEVWATDYCWRENGDLVLQNRYHADVLVEGEEEFEQIDLTEERKDQ